MAKRSVELVHIERICGKPLARVTNVTSLLYRQNLAFDDHNHWQASWCVASCKERHFPLNWVVSPSVFFLLYKSFFFGLLSFIEFHTFSSSSEFVKTASPGSLISNSLQGIPHAFGPVQPVSAIFSKSQLNRLN
jgi:hypothetical protein